MRFHLIRHGQTQWNVERRIQGQLDSELNELGFAQAVAAGRKLAGIPFEAVYCSSSLRTRQTVNALLGNRDDTVVYMDELKEVCFGIWQGAMWSDIEAAHPDMVEAYHKALPHFHVEGAETPPQTQARGVETMEALIERHARADADANILVVSHGAIMKKILGHYTGIALTQLHRLPPLPNCAHCIIDVTDEQRRVTSIAGEAMQDSVWQTLST